MVGESGQEPFALDCVLEGVGQRHHRISSIAVHGEKLYVGSTTGSLSIYRLPSSTLTSAQSPSKPKAQHLSTHPTFHPANRAVNNLRILPALSLILSSCSDGTIHTTSLATLEAVDPPAPIKDLPAKSVLAFEVQTTVVDWPKEEEFSAATASSGRASLNKTPTRANQTRRGLQNVDSGKTLPRGASNSSLTGGSSRPRPMSVFQRQDTSSSHNKGQQEPSLNLRLVTTVAVSIRRKVVVVRWVDGQPWDCKEISLAHTPRALAFAPSASPAGVATTTSSAGSIAPASSATLFMSYGTSSDFGVLEVPPAYDSAALRLHDPGRPADEKREFIKDDREWNKPKELHIPEYAVDHPLVSNSATAASSNRGEGGSRAKAGLDAGEGASSGPDQQGNTRPGFPAAATAAGGLFGGLGGYIGLGTRSKPPFLRAVPSVSSSKTGSSVTAQHGASDPSQAEVTVVRDNTAVFLSFKTGNPTRRRGLEWPSAVDDLAILPSGHLFAAVPGAGTNRPSLQARSTATLDIVQTVSLPPLGEGSTTSSGHWSISSLLAPPSSASTSAASSLYAVLSPSSSSEAARIYRLTPRPWRLRLREMIRSRKWEDSVQLVRESLTDGQIDDEDDSDANSPSIESGTGTRLNDTDTKSRLLPPLLALLSLERFLTACLAAERKQMQSAHIGFEAAVEQWIELDLNPAKVLSIFPESIAGHGLSRPKAAWVKVWGAELEAAGFSLDEIASDRSTVETATAPAPPNVSRRGSLASTVAQQPEGSIPIPRDRSRLTGLFGRASRPQSIVDTTSAGSSPRAETTTSIAAAVAPPSPAKEPSTAERSGRKAVRQPDIASARSGATSPAPAVLPDPQTFDESLLLSRISLEALGRFLADRRRIFKPILEDRPAVSPTSLTEVATMPSVPLPSMSLEDLTALACVVDTALFKTFLETKPSLVGPLCRIQNWCEVNEVEEILEAKGKTSELINLYGGKDMHDRALKLLRKFAEDEDDEEEKVGPTIRYLQSLGPEHIGVILESAKWVLAEDQQRGMEIFTADAGKVSSLPRLEIVNLLWSLDQDLCAQYLEHIIHNVGDGDPELHEKLALIYLSRVQSDPKDSDKQEHLLQFLSESQQYRPERLLTQVPPDGLWEVRAVLLGRMGQHRGALGIYVERIGGDEGERKAEAYCSAIYKAAQTDDERNIFLLLFKLYLRPAQSPTDGSTMLKDLSPALRLLSQHASSLDISAVLDLLPPLVPIASIRHFLVKGLQMSHRQAFNASVISSISKERDVQLDEGVKALQSRRVKVTQGRTCPVCGKRLGVSVIAVTSRGEVLHYGCKQQQQQQQQQQQSQQV